MNVRDPADSDIDLDESHEFALRRAARYLSQLYSRQLVSIGLTAPQFTMLRTIDRHGSLTMAELARRVGSDRSTLVRAAQVLRKDGFLASSLGPPPGRRTVLTLTPLGAQRVEQGRALWCIAQRDFEARFGVERARHLRAELFGITGQAPVDEHGLTQF
ncbi:MarR family winged helix-turn-helix transcriptional regulator [Pararobbsia silviterrae]|uniref:MarR family transcriptional regulator n=1 Tax=Pararobbsia silviterrae TaxID=1792498 RepID=A0A494XPX2_9BURK|nr:MarR family transcriptional regulator [Pararobbsia silviterrae]RKP49583.1 MarR family transcriptional regulator [Pararobbsia silviterrae]